MERSRNIKKAADATVTGEAGAITIATTNEFKSAAKYTNLSKIDLDGVTLYKGQSIQNRQTLTSNASFVQFITALMPNMPQKDDKSSTNGSVTIACEIVSFDVTDANVRMNTTNRIEMRDGQKVVAEEIKTAKIAGVKADGTNSYEEQRIICEFKVGSDGKETWKGNMPAEIGVLAAKSADGIVNITFFANHSKNERYPINVWANPA